MSIAQADTLTPVYEAENEARTILNDAALATALESLPGWTHEAGGLERTFDCGDFATAIAFIVKLSYACEAIDHHPEIRNVYGKVHIRSTTYDVSEQVTTTDLALARKIDAAYASIVGSTNLPPQPRPTRNPHE